MLTFVLVIFLFYIFYYVMLNHFGIFEKIMEVVSAVQKL